MLDHRPSVAPSPAGGGRLGWGRFRRSLSDRRRWCAGLARRLLPGTRIFPAGPHPNPPPQAEEGAVCACGYFQRDAARYPAVRRRDVSIRLPMLDHHSPVAPSPARGGRLGWGRFRRSLSDRRRWCAGLARRLLPGARVLSDWPPPQPSPASGGGSGLRLQVFPAATHGDAMSASDCQLSTTIRSLPLPPPAGEGWDGGAFSDHCLNDGGGVRVWHGGCCQGHGFFPDGPHPSPPPQAEEGAGCARGYIQRRDETSRITRS